jgi:hypothetical protein
VRPESWSPDRAAKGAEKKQRIPKNVLEPQSAIKNELFWANTLKTKGLLSNGSYHSTIGTSDGHVGRRTEKPRTKAKKFARLGVRLEWCFRTSSSLGSELVWAFKELKASWSMHPLNFFVRVNLA